MGCKISSRHYTGTKGNKIREMIDDKLKDEFNKREVPKILKNSELKYLKEQITKKYDEVKALEAQYAKILKAFKVREITEYVNSGEKFRTYTASYDECFVPNKVILKLERAKVLMELGRIKEANNIYDELITEYELI